MGISLSINDLIYPYFVVPGNNVRKPIRSFPQVYRLSIDRLLLDLSESRKLGIKKILLFGVSNSKDPMGSFAYKKNNLIASVVRAIKLRFPDIVVMTDVCLCGYTDHGHCGITGAPVKIDSKKTLQALAKMALSHAEAGADWVAPSAMVKGQVIYIRRALDKAGFKKVKIMGYSAKFASNFYGPF